MMEWRRDIAIFCLFALVILIFNLLMRLQPHSQLIQKLPAAEQENETYIKPVHSEPKSENHAVDHYDVLLNSYMRSGSTFTGKILGFREDTFYFYEPLWKLSVWSYWHGNDTICSSNIFGCRAANGSLEQVTKTLQSIYHCKFDFISPATVNHELTITFGGPKWSQIRSCSRTGKGDSSTCMQRLLPSICKKSTHIVSKVLRITTDLLGQLLHELPNLKVIHLFRDPRAIINSRRNTGWYPIRNNNQIIQNAKSLCNKMLYDFQKGKTLYNLFPDRFRFIYFEDIAEDFITKVKQLYRYTGMNVTKAENLSQYQHYVTYKWRHALGWDDIKSIEEVCVDVFKELGYKTFSSKEDYKNKTIRTVDIPRQYLIL